MLKMSKYGNGKSDEGITYPHTETFVHQLMLILAFHHSEESKLGSGFCPTRTWQLSRSWL